MKKLIELLNEYDENWRLGKNGLYKWEEYEPREEYVISKNFGFIQRLVDNDKIDYNKDKYGMIFYENGNQKFLSSEDEVIMELSIQDNPIEFLISILK